MSREKTPPASDDAVMLEAAGSPSTVAAGSVTRESGVRTGAGSYTPELPVSVGFGSEALLRLSSLHDDNARTPDRAMPNTTV